ncbi:conserved hypothetical protein [Theileria equi strain WA]|uniref:Uncharacterized protein n=1 Tax=Theileria equi strain WA TaxID=1537102 RepID=L1LG97_THEEQ|nr:conserved hypothetical protein [Theileria equi strain WA]EKX74178.1 conserved hypothetical protein [Theileria equi strain WA]|eukprot:XP_004833630.1 conserved hypothetical protein [Theileria equi strain WA]
MLYVKLLEKYLNNVNRHLLTCTRSFSKPRHRKKLSIYPNKSDIRGDVRKAPAKLLKGNLFTPESAGSRELSMLCYWIVNYGYADSSILTRYVECAINSVDKLNIKNLALILHSVSKYVYTYPTIQMNIRNKPSIDNVSEHKGGNLVNHDSGSIEKFVDASGSDMDTVIQGIHSDADMNKYSKKATKTSDELSDYNRLILKSMEFIEKMCRSLPRLLPRGSPKDLGMIALSVSNLYDVYLRDVDDSIKVIKSDGTSESLTDDKNIKYASANLEGKGNHAKDEPPYAKQLWKIVKNILRGLSEEILPKLSFCEVEELAALAKAFTKYPELDFCSYFMKELALETSTVLLEKCEQMNDLLRNVYIGDDLVKNLHKLPRELTTIVCSMKKLNIKEKIFYERALNTVNFLIMLKKMDKTITGSKPRYGNTDGYSITDGMDKYLPNSSEHFGYRESIESLRNTLDAKTLALLSTALVSYGSVTSILEHICETANDSDLQPLATSFAIAANSLEIDLAKELLSKIDASDISQINPEALPKFIRGLHKIPSLDDNYIENIKKLIVEGCNTDVMTSVYIHSDKFRMGKTEIVQLATKISSEVENMSLYTVIHLFYKITNVLSDSDSYEDNLLFKINSDTTNLSQNEVNGDLRYIYTSSVLILKGPVLSTLNKRYMEVPVEHMIPVLKYTIGYHGDAYTLILNLCKRLSKEVHLFPSTDILDIYHELKNKGFNSKRAFKGIAKNFRLECKDSTANKYRSLDKDQNDNLEVTNVKAPSDISIDAVVENPTEVHSISKHAVPISSTLHSGNDSDVKIIADAMKNVKDVKPLNLEYFRIDESEYEPTGMQFEFRTFHEDSAEQDEPKKKALWPKGVNSEDLQLEWKSHRLVK